MSELTQSDREQLALLAAEMPAYFAAIASGEKTHQDFVDRWNKNGSLFQGAVLRYLADNVEEVYYLLAQDGARIAGTVSGRAHMDGFDKAAAQKAGNNAGVLFYLSLGLNDIRGENFVLLRDGLCESKLQEMSLILTQLNTKATTRDEVMQQLDAIRNSKAQRPALFERIQAGKNESQI